MSGRSIASLLSQEHPGRWQAPTLLAGDVRELIDIYQSVLTMELSMQQRAATEASLARMLGDGAPIPDVPAALVTWFAALIDGDKQKMVLDGRQVMAEVLRAGESQGWEPLQRAMEDLATYVFQMKRRSSTQAPAGDADGPNGEKGSDEAVAWYEPDEAFFYVPYGATGARLLEVLEDLRNVDAYLRLGIDAPTYQLWHGPSGAGKTAAARWFGAQLGKPVALIRLDLLGSSWMNRTARNLRACFESAQKRQAIIVIDEFDGLASRRDDKDASESQKRMVTTTNQLFDALDPSQIVIGCTNLPDAIDPALTRRFDTRIGFGLPDGPSRETMIRHHWSKLLVSPLVVERLVLLTEERTGDFVRRVAHETGRRAIRAGRDELLLVDVHAAMAATPRDGSLEPRSLSL